VNCVSLARSKQESVPHQESIMDIEASLARIGQNLATILANYATRDDLHATNARLVRWIVGTALVQFVLCAAAIRFLLTWRAANPSSNFYTSWITTSILPRVAFEYGQVWWAASTMACATSRPRPGRLTLRRACSR
jgi:hypothetical protein